jgi:hypothetical protein
MERYAELSSIICNTSHLFQISISPSDGIFSQNESDALLISKHGSNQRRLNEQQNARQFAEPISSNATHWVSSI